MNNQKIPNTTLSIMIALAVVGISSNAEAGVPVECGNKIVEDNEECDDGNKTNGDGCDEYCKLETSEPCCGDGHKDGNEECDDGNQSNTDECLNTCDLATCGDHYIEMGKEECDDGNTKNGDGCNEHCYLEMDRGCCGDGHKDWNEECDDGNTTNGDGCNEYCHVEKNEPCCGDGMKEGDEECDDGNASNTDACLSNCEAATCGDSYVQMGEEECDDGNQTSGDGCSSTCTIDCDDGNDGDGVTGCDDLCPNTGTVPEGVPTEELLPNHYALTDEGAPYTFDTYDPKLKDVVETQGDKKITIVDTGGCSCEQILGEKNGNNEGEYKHGCTVGTIKNWIKYVEDGEAAPPEGDELDVNGTPQMGCNVGNTRNGLALALLGLVLAGVGRRRRS